MLYNWRTQLPVIELGKTESRRVNAVGRDRLTAVSEAVLTKGENMGEIEEVEFGHPLILAQISIHELRTFYHDARGHFGSRVAGLEALAEKTSPEDEESDYLVARMEEVEGFLDLVEYFGVIGAYRTFEIFLREVVNKLRNRGLVEGKTERYLDDLKDQFKEIGVWLVQPPFQWREIRKLQAIRNCIVHNEGLVNKKERF